jgi:hypothetical protein
MKMMLAPSDLREGAIAAGLDRARSFTWEKAARELLAIYARFAPQQTA